ncbi:unnamed protein product [Cladocopium goreaui]|uniref:Uncharacterized protein n=1 Tax=Cladocopium goreaui TaxID=2562237 RepID=A0A9P1GBV8_9DINO|nr:unnamed protein product [Cladocopium goreaui]
MCNLVPNSIAGELVPILTSQVYDAVEVFCGVASLSRCLQLGGYDTASLDIGLWNPWMQKRLCSKKRLGKKCKRNPLNLLCPAGFGLLLSAILNSKDGVVVAFGLVCSTFITISRGSTFRHYFLPEGDPHSLSVSQSNLLAARTFLAMLVVMAKQGVWVLEQPSTSLAFRLRGFQKLLRTCTVFRQSFWMRGFGSKTPKRTTLWSNSSGVRFFCTSKKARKGRGGATPKLADTYRDALGRKRFKGNANLRKSQEYPVGFGVRFAESMKHLKKERSSLKQPKWAPRLTRPVQSGAPNTVSTKCLLTT